MSHLSRRQLLAGFLGGLVQTAGTIVLARAVLSETAEGKEADTTAAPPASLQERADRLAAEQETPGDDGDLQEISFLNGAFRNGGFANGGGGGFRNGAFRNGGGFRNGGFANGGGGGFRNGGFGNGGGGFRNGAFRN